jgi:hypothetical protein
MLTRLNRRAVGKARRGAEKRKDPPAGRDTGPTPDPDTPFAQVSIPPATERKRCPVS